MFSCRALWGAAGSMTSWRSSFWTLQGKNPWRGVVWWSSAEVLMGSNAGVPCMKSRIVTKLMDMAMVWYGYILEVSCLCYIDVVDPIFFVGESGCSCWLSHASSPAHSRMLVFSFTLSLVSEWRSPGRQTSWKWPTSPLANSKTVSELSWRKWTSSPASLGCAKAVKALPHPVLGSPCMQCSKLLSRFVYWHVITYHKLQYHKLS